MSKVSYSFDWIRATMSIENNVKMTAEPIKAWFESAEWWEADKCPSPYKDGFRSKYAGIYWHPEYAEFGVMVECTGADLSQMRADAFMPDGLIEWIEQRGGRFTRVDFAIDLINTGARPSDVYKAWMKRKVQTPARKITLLQNRNAKGAIDGETVYIGSRQSEKLIRIYDKAKEQGKGGDWIRVELELKQGHARAFVVSMQRNGAIRTALSYLRSMIRYSTVEWLEDLFESKYKVFPVAQLGRKETNFERWFWKMIFPAIERAARENLPGARASLENVVANWENLQHGP